MESAAGDVDRHRAAHHRRAIAHGGWWGLGTMGIALPYALLTGGSHAGWLIGAAVAGVLISVALGLAGTLLTFGPRWRRPVMYVYSAAHIAITAVLAIADGGADSPMALGFFGTFTFVAYTMPPRLLAVFGGLNVAAYLSVYAVAGAHRPEYVPVALAGLLATASACAAQHHNLVRQRRKLYDMARTDPLTGCLNRRGFEERLAAGLAGTRGPAGTGLAVLVVDLDDFKAVNDLHGHAAGDRLLERTVAVMREVLGAAPAIGRLGGDEFAVVLEGVDEGVARSRAGALRQRLAASAPASVGVGLHGPDGTTAEALLTAADRRLYAQKATRVSRRAAA
jgi:diguanylate cyclase (GGDEF)-like protein